MKKLTAIVALLAALTLAACGGGSGSETSATTTATTGPEAAAPNAPATSQGGSSQGQGNQQGSSQQQSSQQGGSQGNQQGAGAGQSDKQGGNQGQGAGAKQGGRSGAAPGDTSAGFTPPPHSDSGGGARQFETKGADNSIQESGSEASGSELAQAATALHGYLDARAAGAWSAACSYMAAGVADSLSQLAGSSGQQGQSCAQLLAALSGGVSPAALREGAEADVGSLRANGDSGFLLFHGAHGTAYFAPMAREGGAWKVAAIAPSAIP